MKVKIFTIISVSLCISLVFSINRLFKEPINYCAHNDLLELIRIAYDLKGTSAAEIYNCINDSILVKESPLEIRVVPHVNEVESIIDWALWYSDYPNPFGIPDRLLFNIDLYKKGEIKIHDLSAKLSDIKKYARNYIFYPDSSEWPITNNKHTIEEIGIVETSKVNAILKIKLIKPDGFNKEDWKYFFKVLHELIELFEEERNKLSQNLWKTNFEQLSFNNKEIVTDLIGYRIIIHCQVS